MTTRPSADDADIDLGGLIAAIWRRRLLVLASSVALGALAFGGASLVPPKYQSEAKILIETRSPDLARRTTEVQVAAQNPDEASVASQVELLRSADLVRQVARDFKLADRKEFDPSADPSIFTRLAVMLGLISNPLDVPPEDRVLKEFYRKLQVYQVEKSRVIAVEFSSEDPRLAADIPNAIIKVYLSLQSGAKLNTTSETARWLEPEIANLREKVREAEARVAEYRATSDLFKTGQQNTFSEQQLTDISQELARVRGERANAEARAAAVRKALDSGRGVDTLNEVVGSQMIQKLKETQSSIEGQIADLSTQLLDGHPRIKGLKSQLEGIRRQIQSETRKILQSLENEAAVARLREEQLEAQLEQLKADSATREEKQVGLNELEREAAAQRQLLETYLMRYRQAVSEQDMNATPADARIVSQATLPAEPYFPKVLPITIVATLAGFLLSSVYVMLAELFSGRAIRPLRHDDYDYDDREDPPVATVAVPVTPKAAQARVAEAFGEAPVPAEPRKTESAPQPKKESLLSLAEKVAAFEKEMQHAVVRDMSHEEAEETDADKDDTFSIASVARHLLDNDINVAIVVSLAGDNGSAVTVELARRVADAARRTILVDMTGSALPTRLMMDDPLLPGITNLLSGDAAFVDTIHPDQWSDAHILPHGTANARRAMRGADRLAMIVDALANAYDLVLVECGPADVAGVSRLARKGRADIVLSAADASEEEIEKVATSFLDAGYEDVILMIDHVDITPTGERRRAA